MQYNVAQLLLEPTGSTRSFSVERTPQGPPGGAPQNALGVQGAQGTVHMLRTHQGILVHAMLDVEMSQDCCRCLSTYRYASSIDIEEEFLPLADPHTGRSLDAEDDDEADFRIDDEHTLDLTEAVRQYAIVGEPLKPLCQVNCSGLCHFCGANLNLSPCQCQGVSIDPRWTALAQLQIPDDH